MLIFALYKWKPFYVQFYPKKIFKKYNLNVTLNNKKKTISEFRPTAIQDACLFYVATVVTSRKENNLCKLVAALQRKAIRRRNRNRR